MTVVLDDRFYDRFVCCNDERRVAIATLQKGVSLPFVSQNEHKLQQESYRSQP